MPNKRHRPSALASVLHEPLGVALNTLTDGDVSVALAAVFAIVFDAAANCTTAGEVFAVLNRTSKFSETNAEVKRLLNSLVDEGLISVFADRGKHFFIVTEVGYLRAVQLFGKI